MPAKSNTPEIQCAFYSWRLFRRNGVYFADGRSHSDRPGRRSLGTKDEAEARRLLVDLDRLKAEACGLAPRRSASTESVAAPLLLLDGRKLFEAHLARSPVTGGIQPSTQKRYRAILDKFLTFCATSRIGSWNDVDASVLERYSAFLQPNYAAKTIHAELTLCKQIVKWLIDRGHLQGREPIRLAMRKAQSQAAYCWRPEEVDAMLALCLESPELGWLHDVILTLATTGLRIAELAGLRWSDICLDDKMLSLSDETGVSPTRKSEDRRRLKSGRGRSLPIHDDLLLVLQRLPQRTGLVLRGPRGGKLKPDTVRRILVRDVLTPLGPRFPSPSGGQGFSDGRLHSFRHYFCSTCANSRVPEPMLMPWLGHADSAMVRRYYHLHDADARQKLCAVRFVGVNAAGRPAAVHDSDSVVDQEAPKPT
ncbi:site-specific tyrosine recombinase XerC [Pirellulimonas nuda]|uniref:Site-specific tyrosine recombinase XerC n=1 Tax=Pirellulimonas nuda TaxID=2528009 RepID=A0A518DAS9_9BACT|nr:tyrosine-type recombinase/integrase [Pirellulimonas nuda]QDU88581.1 site-specific tyrosine recombinase XerC [Pirellulimonas nuda]